MIEVAGTERKTPRDLLKGWQWVRLGDVSRVVSGSTPSSTVRRILGWRYRLDYAH